jgi:CRP-like cAMP-binding protein
MTDAAGEPRNGHAAGRLPAFGPGIGGWRDLIELGTTRHYGRGKFLLEPGGCDDCQVIAKGVVSVRFGERAVEVDLLGPGELVNIGAILETDENEHFAVALTDCETTTIAGERLRRLADEEPRLRPRLLRYVQKRVVQSMRAAECHLSHSTEQRLACWIAIATELLDCPEVRITHNELSNMLGVRRPTITLALQQLEGYRAIWSRRSRIVVRERSLLVEHACSCLAARQAAAGPEGFAPALPAE